MGPKTLATEGRQEVWGAQPADLRQLNDPSQLRALGPPLVPERRPPATSDSVTGAVNERRDRDLYPF